MGVHSKYMRKWHGCRGRPFEQLLDLPVGNSHHLDASIRTDDFGMTQQSDIDLACAARRFLLQPLRHNTRWRTLYGDGTPDSAADYTVNNGYADSYSTSLVTSTLMHRNLGGGKVALLSSSTSGLQ